MCPYLSVRSHWAAVIVSIVPLWPVDPLEPLWPVVTLHHRFWPQCGCKLQPDTLRSDLFEYFKGFVKLEKVKL